MVERIDAWLGLRIFHPPAILLCWILRCSQYRLNRDMWFALLLYITWSWTTAGKPWWMITIAMASCVFAGLRASFLPESHKDDSWIFWRMFVTVILLDNIAHLDIEGAANCLYILVAEYALTITTIPPRPKFGRRRLKESTT